MAWFGCSTIIEVRRNGEIWILQKQGTVDISKLKPFPPRPGRYQWRPVYCYLFSKGEYSFWTSGYGWGKVVPEEPKWWKLPVVQRK